MTKKSQDELEQPVKGWELAAVDAKINGIDSKLDTVIQQTSGLATTAQVNESKKDVIKYVDDKIEKVHLVYGPSKDNMKWLSRAVLGLAFMLVGEIILLMLDK